MAERTCPVCTKRPVWRTRQSNNWRHLCKRCYHKAKMFQTCGSATLSESESTINAREGSDDYPSAALPLLPRN